MSNEKEVTNGVNAQTPVKKARRGVSNETQATNQLRFHEKDAAPNRLFMAHLHSITVAWSQNTDGKQFTGEKVPRLVLEFCSNTTDKNQMRHAYHSLFPVESNVDTIPGGEKEWQVNQVINNIKHVLEVFYLKGRKFTAEEEEALTLNVEDFDEEGNYNPIEPKEVLAGYATLFTNAAAMLNGTFNLADGETAKPCYRDESGHYVRCWIKLLRCKKNKGVWKNVDRNGDLAFDPFIGTGLYELAPAPNSPNRVISVDESKESITPKEVDKPVNVPGIASGAGVIPGTIPGAQTVANSAYTEAGNGEMPF